MRISISKDYAQMSRIAAEEVIEATRGKNKMLFCFPAGDTPTGMMKEIVSGFNSEKVDMKEKRFVSLDEWVGIGMQTQGSCINYMTSNLYSNIDVRDENICFFDGLAEDLEEQCEIVDGFIDEFGPIDVCVLGIGMNGHLGFNESGISFDLDSHIITLDDTTKNVSAKYFKEEVAVKLGISIGIKQIMKSKKIILIANGLQKAKIVKAAFEGKITNEVPASILQNHDNLHVCLDQEAGSLLERK